jgi:hypothetical protein
MRVGENGSALDDGRNFEEVNLPPSMGVGVVRIHSIDLKGKTINPNRYLKTKDHTDPRHLRLNFPMDTFQLVDDQLGPFGTQLDLERRVFQGQAQSKIIDKMVCNARKLGITYRGITGTHQLVGTFTQLCNAWKQDNVSSERQLQMHSVCVGCFEKNWDQKMEQELMKAYGLSYNAPTSARNKGCLSILFSYERSKLVKRVNKRAGGKKRDIGNVGNKIRVTRTVHERNLVGDSRSRARDFLAPIEVSVDWAEVMCVARNGTNS